MAKQDKYLIAQWVETNPSGGVSMAGIFCEYRSQTIKDQNGRTRRIPSDTPTSLTIRAIAGDDGDEVEYDGEKIFLNQGEFIVQNNEENVKALKRMCKMGSIMMRDEDLHEEYLLNAPLKTPEKVVIPPKEVKKEKEITDSELEALTCLKINREKVFEQLNDFGIDSLEKLSEMTIEQLTIIKGVGEKMAELMIQEAKELSKEG